MRTGYRTLSGVVELIGEVTVGLVTDLSLPFIVTVKCFPLSFESLDDLTLCDFAYEVLDERSCPYSGVVLREFEELAISRPWESMGGNSEPLLLVLSDRESVLERTLENPFCSFVVLLVGVRLLKKFAMLCKPRLPVVSFSLCKNQRTNGLVKDVCLYTN